MTHKFGWLSLMLSAGLAIGCGSDNTGNPSPTNDTPPVDDTPVVTDNPTPSDVRDAGGDARADAATPTDGPASRAGASCTMPGEADPACGDGDLQCVPTQTTPICTADCENNSSQAMERAACGGNGSTCLTQGDPPGMTASLCAAACRPAGTTPATMACRAGNVCTGWWFTHAGGRPDTTGCFPFCDADSQCGMGMHCNTRTGDCGPMGVDMTRLPDGAPCNPRMTVMVPGETQPRNIQCRGICFRVTDDQTQGICGSLMNIRASTMCPDDPDNVQPRAPMGTDNLALCIWRGCTTNSDCRSPHICRFPEQDGMPVTDADPLCDYPTMAQRTGIAGDGGMPGDAATDAPTDRPADAAPTDVTPTDAAPADAAPTDAAVTDGGSAG